MTVDNALLAGRYRLERLIGRGGMASVWRATDTELGRVVAIKRLHARLSDDPELAERFRREGQAVARLSHPNLVRLLDQGQEGAEPFLVFELVEGRDLKTIIRREGRRSPAEAASICGQVARALAAAHEAGVVHRDIKSHNVIVTDEGVAKLTDFGIARIIESEGANLTKTGIVMGSSDYLAPEQAEGRSVDERGDIYSLGVVLFEALTGELPFRGDNPVAVATKHVYEDAPNPAKIAPGIPGYLAAACTRALAKKPRERFPTAAAFANALEGEATAVTLADFDEPGTARLRPARKRSKRVPAAALAIAAVAAAGVGAWQMGAFDGGSSASAASALAVELVDHDPEGDDKTENADEVANANDRDPTTAWRTAGYVQADLGEKSGVGLRVTLASAARVTRVRLTSSTPGAQVEVRGPGDDSAATRPVLASGELVDGVLELPITAAAPVSELVIWLTSLPQSGTGDFPFRAAIGEVEVLGVANS